MSRSPKTAPGNGAQKRRIDPAEPAVGSFGSFMTTDLNSGSSGKERSSSSMHFEVSLPADVTAISPVVSWVMRLVGELEYAAGKEFEIEMALREALANAILHGCKGDPGKKVECSVTGDQDQGILIVVRDPGNGFDPAPFHRPRMIPICTPTMAEESC